MNGEGAWPDLEGKIGSAAVIHLGNDAQPIKVSVLEGGMSSGKASVMIRLDLPDGRTVLAETSLALFLTAAKAFEAKFPDTLT
jgi:hypothetical protein